jgi:hypothetical protein
VGQTNHVVEHLAQVRSVQRGVEQKEKKENIEDKAKDHVPRSLTCGPRVLSCACGAPVGVTQMNGGGVRPGPNHRPHACLPNRGLDVYVCSPAYERDMDIYGPLVARPSPRRCLQVGVRSLLATSCS